MKQNKKLYSEMSAKQRLKEAWSEGSLYRFYKWLEKKRSKNKKKNELQKSNKKSKN